jgi:hypothetical protein
MEKARMSLRALILGNEGSASESEDGDDAELEKCLEYGGFSLPTVLELIMLP